MSIVINSHLNQKTKIISVITLVAFLLAFFLHSQHVTNDHIEQNVIVDYQDCHICQQGIDSPPKAIQLTTSIRSSLALIILQFVESVNYTIAYALPQLRAPPFFL